jgi:diazepam-binding inhibitor (GABA receptor modulating acyl-CoA-binding protein)
MQEGDVKGEQPWAVQMEARAKWDAWAGLKGMTRSEAMRKYVELLAADDVMWEDHPALKEYNP